MKMTLLVAALLAASVCGTVGLYYNIQSSSDQTAANATSSVDGAAADRADGTPKTSPATATVDESYGGAPPEYASSSDLLTESMSMSAGGGMGGAGGMGPGDATPSSSARMGMEMGGAPGGAAGPTSDAVGGDGRPMEETPGMPAPGEPDGRTPRSGQLTAGASFKSSSKTPCRTIPASLTLAWSSVSRS